MAGINCQIIRNPYTNQIDRVEAPNGEMSILYQNALNETQNPEKALDIWAVNYTDEFQELVLANSPRFQSTAINNYNKEREKIRREAQERDNWMKAPNGNPTNLTEHQWITVRTSRFKEWFGDWENNPESASKVVDENGEPLVVYHGTAYNFNTFKIELLGKSTGNFGWFGPGFYFATTEKTAKGYGSLAATNLNTIGLTKSEIALYKEATMGRKEGVDYFPIMEKVDALREEAKKKIRVIPAFLNIKNIQKTSLKEFGDNFNQDNTKDGVIAYDNKGDIYEIAVRESNQIKSATENIGEFSRDNNDIRFQQRSTKTIQQPTQIAQEVVKTLQKTGLAKRVELLSPTEMEKQLVTFGVSRNIAKQVVAYHGRTRELNFSEDRGDRRRYGEVLSGIYFGEPYIAAAFSGTTSFTTEEDGVVAEAGLDDTDFYVIDMKGTTPSGDAQLIDLIGVETWDEIVELRKQGAIKGLKLLNTREFLEGETSPTTQYVVYDEQVINILKEYRGQEIQQFLPKFQQLGIDVTPNGFVYNQEVYLNNANPDIINTSIHEFSHLFNDWAKENRPEIYERGLELIEQEGQAYIDFVRNIQPNLEGEALLEEALAEAIGDNGQRLIDEAESTNLLQWLQDLFNTIKRSVGITNPNFNLQTATLEEYTQAVTADLLSGRNIQDTTDTSRIHRDLVTMLGGYPNTVEANSNMHRTRKESEEVEAFAKSNGYYINNLSENYIETEMGGSESDVYLNPENPNTVVKNFTPAGYNGYQSALGKILLHNHLFPNTNYSLIGISEMDGISSLVLEQPFIENTRNATTEEIHQFIENIGFEITGTRNGSLEATNTEGVIIRDLDGDNIQIGQDGEIYVIDATIEYEGTPSFNVFINPNATDGLVDANGEATLETVLDYIRAVNTENVEDMTPTEVETVKNMMISTGIANSDVFNIHLQKLFPQGRFSEEGLRASTIFNRGEKEAIIGDVETQQNLSKLAKQLNNRTEVIYNDIDYNEDFVLFTGNKNKYGKYEVKNPLVTEQEIKKIVAGIEDRELFDSAFNNIPFPTIIEKYNTDEDFAQRMYENYSTLRKLPVQTIEGGEIIAKLENNRTITVENTANLENSNFGEDIRFLSQVPFTIWEESQEEISQALSQIEQKGVEAAIDLEGLSEKYFTNSRNEILNFLATLNNLETTQTEENLQTFLQAYNEFFDVQPIEATQIAELSPENRAKTLVYVTNPSSEYEMFDQHSLVKVDNNLYQKINKTTLDGAYESIYAQAVVRDNRILPNEAYFGEDVVDTRRLSDPVNKPEILNSIRYFINNNIYQLDLGVENFDSETAQLLLLYKYYFNNPINTPPVNTFAEDLPALGNFDGDSNYLSSDYISDFQTEKLKEREKDSDVYNQVYSQFAIGESGIIPINNDVISLNTLSAAISELLTEEQQKDLRNYAVVSKNRDIKMLFPTDPQIFTMDTMIQEREYYQNYPNALPDFKENYRNINASTIVTEDAGQTFIRINNKLFEKAQDSAGQSFYRQIVTYEGNFNTIEPQEPVNKFDYQEIKQYLRDSETQETINNLYTQEELDQINEQEFSCN